MAQKRNLDLDKIIDQATELISKKRTDSYNFASIG